MTTQPTEVFHKPHLIKILDKTYFADACYTKSFPEKKKNTLAMCTLMSIEEKKENKTHCKKLYWLSIEAVFANIGIKSYWLPSDIKL